MDEKYCVTIPGAPKHHEHDTMAALLEVDKTFAPLQIFDSVDEAVAAARADKSEHPDRVYEIRQYYGNNTDMLVIAQQGRWKMGREVLQRV